MKKQRKKIKGRENQEGENGESKTAEGGKLIKREVKGGRKYRNGKKYGGKHN